MGPLFAAVLGPILDAKHSFVRKHGALVQVELDALPPDALQHLYRRALASYWDTSAFEQALARERIDRAQLVPPPQRVRQDG